MEGKKWATFYFAEVFLPSKKLVFGESLHPSMTIRYTGIKEEYYTRNWYLIVFFCPSNKLDRWGYL